MVRKSPTSTDKHSVVRVLTYRISDLLMHLNVTAEALWAAVRRFFEHCAELDNGRYLVVKPAGEVRYPALLLPLMGNVCSAFAEWWF